MKEAKKGRRKKRRTASHIVQVASIYSQPEVSFDISPKGDLSTWDCRYEGDIAFHFEGVQVTDIG